MQNSAMNSTGIRSELVNLVCSNDIFIATASYCSYCVKLLQEIRRMNIPEETVRVINEAHPLLAELRKAAASAFNNYSTVPLVFIKGRFYKGYTDFMMIKDKISKYSSIPMLDKDLVLTKEGWGIDVKK